MNGWLCKGPRLCQTPSNHFLLQKKRTSASLFPSITNWTITRTSFSWNVFQRSLHDSWKPLPQQQARYYDFSYGNIVLKRYHNAIVSSTVNTQKHLMFPVWNVRVIRYQISSFFLLVLRRPYVTRKSMNFQNSDATSVWYILQNIRIKLRNPYFVYIIWYDLSYYYLSARRIEDFFAYYFDSVDEIIWMKNENSTLRII